MSVMNKLFKVINSLNKFLYEEVPGANTPDDAPCRGALCKYSYMKVLMLKAFSTSDVRVVRDLLNNVFRFTWGPGLSPQLSESDTVRVRDVLASFYTRAAEFIEALRELVSVWGIGVGSATEVLAVLNASIEDRPAYIVNRGSLRGLLRLYESGVITEEPAPLEEFKEAALKGDEDEWVKLVEPFEEAEHTLRPIISVTSTEIDNAALVLDAILYLTGEGGALSINPSDLREALLAVKVKRVVD